MEGIGAIDVIRIAANLPKEIDFTLGINNPIKAYLEMMLSTSWAGSVTPPHGNDRRFFL